METITCFNRDQDGKCLAYSIGECSEHCQARIRTVERKIELLTCLLIRAESKKERRRLSDELQMAKRAKSLLDEKKFEDWMSCYLEDRHRGSGGGQSESDANAKTGMKQKMKDNRPVGIKPTKAQTQEYKEALQQFEEKVGEKIERLGRSGMTHSRVDSYTGTPFCFVDHGLGHCNGQRSAKGSLTKDCRECPHLWEENNR